MTPTLLFLLFTALAFVLFVAEMFVPGGILAIVGGFCLLAACGCAIAAFGVGAGLVVALLLIALTLGGCLYWVSIMPDSRMGKRVSLGHSLKEEEPSPPHPLNGCTGKAETDLRPGGFARIEGRKIDVVASRGYIEEGSRIVVTEVHGSRVVVQPSEEQGE